MRVLVPRVYCSLDDLKIKVKNGGNFRFQEPMWTNLELEIFWHVLHKHVENLLGEESSDPDIDFCDLDPCSSCDYDRCLHHVQELMWCGRYSMAVANFRAARRHFRSCKPTRFADCLRPSDVEFLRLLYMRRMPLRSEV